MPKPDMVILYNCPVARMPARLAYTVDAGKMPHKLVLEVHGIDGMGQERWAPPIGEYMLSHAILAAVLRAVALGKVKPVDIEGVSTIDAREIVIAAPTAT